MLYFLLPLPWLKKGYFWLEEQLESRAGVKAVINYSRQDWVLLLGENGWKLNDTMRIQAIILGIWIGGTVIAGLVLLVYYLRHKRKLQSLCAGAEKEASQQMTDRLVTEMDVRVSVRFLECRKEAMPVTVGFLKSIVFYYAQVPTEEKEMMLKHKLMHIKRKDMVWRFLSIVLVVLNSATVFAYEDVKVYHADMRIEDIPTDVDIAFVPKGEESVWKSPDYVTDYVKIYDKQFVDKEGNVYEVLEDVEACNF